MIKIMCLILVCSLAMSAATFDITQCLTKTECYAYCKNAIDESRLLTAEAMNITINKSATIEEYARQINEDTQADRLIVNTMLGMLGGIFLGGSAMALVLQKFPPKYEDGKMF